MGLSKSPNCWLGGHSIRLQTSFASLGFGVTCLLSLWFSRARPSARYPLGCVHEKLTSWLSGRVFLQGTLKKIFRYLSRSSGVLPQNRTASGTYITPSRLSSTWMGCFGKIWLYTFRINDNRSQTKRSKEVAKVVRRLDFSPKTSCQNSEGKSTLVKKCVWFHSPKISSSTGNLYCFLLYAALRCFGSIYERMTLNLSWLLRFH